MLRKRTPSRFTDSELPTSVRVMRLAERMRDAVMTLAQRDDGTRATEDDAGEAPDTGSAVSPS